MMKEIRGILFFVFFVLACGEEPKIGPDQEDFHLKVFGGSSSNDCCNAVIAEGENLYLTGTINYTSGPDMFLIKTDKYGNEAEWSPKLIGTSGIETGNAVSTDMAGNIYAAGFSQTSEAGSSDFYVAKYSSAGEELWNRKIGGAKDEKAYALNSSFNNSVYIAGYTESISFETKKRQGWVLALSENGDSLWSQDYGINNVADELHGIISMKDSLLLIGTTQTLSGSPNNDVFLFILKKSSRGIENSITLYNEGEQTGVSAVYTAAGEIFVLGNTQESGSSNNNIILWKLDENLQVSKKKQIVTNIPERASALITNGDVLVVVGSVQNEPKNENYLVYILDKEFNEISRNTYGILGKGSQKGISGAIMGRSVIIGGCTSTSENSSKASIFKTPEIIP